MNYVYRNRENLKLAEVIMGEGNTAIIICLDDCMLLSKKDYSCWKEVQDEYYDKYKTKLPPMSWEEIIHSIV